MTEKSAQKDLQLSISDWQDNTFPNSTQYSMMTHLLEEMIELGDAIEMGDEAKIRAELADCQHLLFGLASRNGVNLMEATAQKFELNKRRRWGKPEASGVVHHIKE